MRLGKLELKGSVIIFILLFLGVSIVVGVLQYYMLAPHLLYGFADVDWVFLYRFKNLPPFSIDQLVQEWRASGVYAYQTYYIGIQELLYELYYYKYHLTTNIFRFLSTVSLFPILLYISKNKLLASLTTIVYGVSYTAIGAMYTVVTSGIYLAVTIINLFLLLYIYSIKKNDTRWWVIIGLFVLFFSALFWSTERLYPIFPLILLIEGFLIWREKFRRASVVASFKRSLLVFIPLLLGLLYKPYAATNVQFLGNTRILFEKIQDGNWHLLLTPFVSLGGMFVPREYWNIFGVVNDLNFSKYMEFYVINFGFILLILTIVLAVVVSRKPLMFILITLGLTFLMSICSFYLINHRLLVPEGVRMNYDPQIYFIPALIGQYITALSAAFFEEWRRSEFRQILYFFGFFGPFMALLFIGSTWLPAEPGLLFTSVHRYLTIPGIGSSLFLVSVIILIFYRLREFKLTRYFAYLILLLMVPIIILNDVVTKEYFKYEIGFTGTNGSEHNRMKGKLWSYLDDFDRINPSLFYFDESLGGNDGYFHETTLLAGFNFWMMLWEGSVMDNELQPELMRSSLLCPTEHVPCLEKVEGYVEEVDGKKGIRFGNKFYLPENIYAFRLAKRDIKDIRREFFEEIGLPRLDRAGSLGKTMREVSSRSKI